VELSYSLYSKPNFLLREKGAKREISEKVKKGALSGEKPPFSETSKNKLDSPRKT
jgi:hypothetical protein